MKRILSIVALMSTASLFIVGQTKPDYSGIWKLRSTASNEIMIIEHQEPKINLRFKIEDDMGNRSFEVKAQTDGKEYKQEIQSAPAIFKAKWEGDALTVELKRIATFGPVHVRRTLKLSKDGKEITTERINYSPEGEEVSRRPEIWDKQ